MLLASVYGQFQKEDTLAFFREIGIYPKEKNGYFYPNSMQAQSVADALSAELRRQKVELMTGVALEGLVPQRGGLAVHTSGGVFRGRSVVLATGLRAAPKLGSDGSVIPVLKSCGHRFRPILPALCGFAAEGMEFRKVSGVRCDAGLTLEVDGEERACERGELQLADYGISGIPVFQISSPAAHALYEKRRACVRIHFLPELSDQEVAEELRRRFRRDGMGRSAADSLCGLLHGKLIPVLFHRAGIDVNQKSGKVDEQGINRLADAICDYPVTLVATRDFTYAQVCTGGLRSEEVEPETLSSRLIPGLFFAGELLDVDGICGGYNLQWAWSSGYVAGCAASNYMRD
jgi:predicted Rossmann fold flavoprotein